MTDDNIVEAMREAYDKASVGCAEDWEDRAMRAALSVARPMIEADARRAGAEEMQERAASAAWTALEAVLFKENDHDTVLEDHIADTIRALPLEG